MPIFPATLARSHNSHTCSTQLLPGDLCSHCHYHSPGANLPVPHFCVSESFTQFIHKMDKSPPRPSCSKNCVLTYHLRHTSSEYECWQEVAILFLLLVAEWYNTVLFPFQKVSFVLTLNLYRPSSDTFVRGSLNIWVAWLGK